jgi:Flp pilus assembly pilin Flp
MDKERGVYMAMVSPGEQHGQSATEYALILVLVAVVTILGMTTFGVSLNGIYCGIVGAVGGNPKACTDSVAWMEDFSNLDAWNIVDG